MDQPGLAEGHKADLSAAGTNGQDQQDNASPNQGGESRSNQSPANPASDQSDEKDESPPKKPVPRWRKVLYIVLGVLVVGGIAVGATLYYLAARHYESTDDAFVDGYLAQISPRVSGRVVQLGFQDNQDVKAGQVLVEIDPSDYQISLVQARAQRDNSAAQLAQMQAQIGLQQANIDQAIANVHGSEADLAKSQQDLARNRSVNPGSVAKQQLDDSASTARSAVAKLESNRQAVAAARAQLEATRAQVQGAQAQLASSDASVANAELQLSYTRVVAPVAGRATKRSIDIGNYATVGVPLLYTVSPDVWITANFKENQTGNMHVGQPVEITVDQYPKLRFYGRVDSFQNGTGSAFSTLPAENATGNYVKVVQRIPVKITFDQHPPGAPDDLRLSPGLSVEPRVKVR